MNNNHSKIALASDSLEDLIHALQLPIPAKMHVDCIRITLPIIIKDIRDAIIEQTKENPWAPPTEDFDDDDDN